MISCPAKCILSGEYAVLEGGTALVAPLRAYRTVLEYQADTALISIRWNDKPLHQRFLRHCLALLPRRGLLKIVSTIPAEAGLGSSAAFCVSLAKFLAARGYILSERIAEVARFCEHIFHGRSSGVDVAGVMAKGAVLYDIKGGAQPFQPTWSPRLYISDVGHRSPTRRALRGMLGRLSGLHLMDKATQMIEQALQGLDPQNRLLQLQEGIHQAGACFQRWGLAGGAIRAHIETLLEAGALAAKPTGSGGGGHVLSLWKAPPPRVLGSLLIPVQLEGGNDTIQCSR